MKVSRVGCCPDPGKDTKLSTDELELGVLSHGDSGGVSTRKGWLLSSEKGVVDLMEVHSVKHTLRHVLDLKNMGKIPSKLEEAKKTCVLPSQLIDLGAAVLKTKVLCGTVFIKGMLVERQLSISEICEVYDIPHVVKSEFRYRNSLPFIDNLPIK